MLDDLADAIEEQMAGAEDRIIRHRLDWLFSQENGFYYRLQKLIEKQQMFQPTSTEIADNHKQELKEFLIDELEVNVSE